jgi:hypothetical protein
MRERKIKKTWREEIKIEMGKERENKRKIRRK